MKKLLIALPLIVLTFFNASIAKADFYDDGILAYRNGKYQKAQYYFKEALKTSPENARYRYYLAITYVQQGDIFAAEKEYKKVIQIAPTSEAADKARKGLKLISLAKQNIIKDQQPTAMSSVLQPSVKRVIIPITKSRNAIIVPKVLINDSMNVNFILDTGATYTSISRFTANKLGLDLKNCNKVALKTANGIIKVPKVVLKTININGLIAQNIEVTVHDLPAARNVTGLLGLSFLDKFTVTIDKKNNKIILEGS